MSDTRPDVAAKLVNAAFNAMDSSGDESARKLEVAKQAVSAVLWELGEVEAFDPATRLGIVLLANKIEDHAGSGG